MQQFIGGLRAGMGYCGSKDIATLQETDVSYVLQPAESVKAIRIM